MSDLLDEQTAWTLIRAMPAALAGRGSARVHHDSSPDAWLQVHESGQWAASSPPTDAARHLIELFLPLQLRADLVIAQLGQSLDGRIATQIGHSHYITGSADIRRLHRLRALVDAVVVGAGTVALDDPRLTVREVDGENPVRVVLDPDGRLDPRRHVFSDGAARTLVVRRGADEALTSIDGDVLAMSTNGRRIFEPQRILDALRMEGYRRVLVEGGGVTVSRFLEAAVVDRLHVTVAPLLIGSGRPALTFGSIETLDQALRPVRCRHFHLGEDLLFDLELR